MTEGAPQQLTDREIKNIVDSVKDTTESESNPKPSEKFGTAFKRKIAAGIAAFTIATGVGATATGCEAKIIPTETIESTVESSETEPSVTTSESGTSVEVDPVGTTETTETTAAPTETTVETTAPTETEITIEQKLQMAPEIEGAEKVIKEINGLERVIYERDGEYIGEYKKEVNFIESDGSIKETGVVALIPSEVQKLLDEQIPTSKDGYLMPLAADLADINDLDTVTVTIGSGDFNLSYPSFQIDCQNNVVDVLNIIPTEIPINRIYVEDLDLLIFTSELNWDAEEVDNSNKMAFLQTMTKYSETTIESLENKSGFVFGDKIATRNGGLISQTMGDLLSEPDIPSNDDILEIDGVPVCLTNNNQ